MILELTDIEAQRYAEGLVHLCDIWYGGDKRTGKFLLQKHLHSYNAIRELIGKLNSAIRDIKATDELGAAFDLDLARDNEAEAKILDQANNNQTED